MKIEIKTVELKKSTIKQMFYLSYGDFDNAEPLGYLNIEKKGKVVLCQVNGNYKLLNPNYERRGNTDTEWYAGYTVLRAEMKIKLNQEIVDDWFAKYNKLVDVGEEKGQIYYI